jgi:hypothetical protein
MNYRRLVFGLLVGVVFGLAVGVGQGRQLEDWSYPKRFQKADLVVIAQFTSLDWAGNDIVELPPDDYLVAVLSTFKVTHVVQGEYSDESLAVVHYLIDEKKLQGQFITNGTLLVNFLKDRSYMLPQETPRWPL